jgi:hypothetical protein
MDRGPREYHRQAGDVMATFRQAAWDLSPSRLRTWRAARMVYAFIGLPLDMIAEAAKQALLVRFPDYCAEDALPYHGRDRGIRRGPNEPAISFRGRLRRWRSLWKGSGVGRAMLDDLAGYLVPQVCRLRIWTQVGIVYTREPDGTFSIDHAPRGLWNWDNEDALFARFWLIIYSNGDVPFARDGTWGDDELWGDDTTATWGSTATLDQVHAIRSIVDDRKPGQAVCKNIIVAFDADAFSLTDTSPPLPDGTWGHWSKNVGGVQVPARDERAIYGDGVA